MKLPYQLQELTLYPNWVVYRFFKSKVLTSKLPFDPINHIPARTNEPNTWTTFEIANNTLRSHSYNGIGFVFSENDPYIGIDLDNCIHFNQINDFAHKILNILNSYTEYSPSKTGLHIICKSNTINYPIGIKKDKIEVYNINRFFTITGEVFRPSNINNIDIDLINGILS